MKANRRTTILRKKTVFHPDYAFGDMFFNPWEKIPSRKEIVGRLYTLHKAVGRRAEALSATKKLKKQGYVVKVVMVKYLRRDTQYPTSEDKRMARIGGYAI